VDKQFFYNHAFQRNIGLLSVAQQENLQGCTVGVVGLGGVGGAYVLSLARAGIGTMLIADFDDFEIANMNRQAGATVSTLGKTKVETLRQMAHDINPFMTVIEFPRGLDESNVEDFVNQCDVVIDAIDFYSIHSHSMLHGTVHRLNKFSLFAIPFGFSATLQVFSPKGMSFENYFNFSSCRDYFEKVAAFAVGAAPKGTHWSYYKITAEQFAAGNVSSLISSVNLCTGFVVSSTLLILSNQWPETQSAPTYLQCDTYKFKLVRGRLPWGNRGPWQQLKRWLIARKFMTCRQMINERDTENRKTFAQATQQAI
jgi:hypothetical protein